MATKNQKFNKFSVEFKMQVINDYLDNLGGVHFLSKKYNISYHTISTWLYTYKKNGNLNDNRNKRGRKKEENIDYKEKYEILKKYQAFLKARREKK